MFGKIVGRYTLLNVNYRLSSHLLLSSTFIFGYPCECDHAQGRQVLAGSPSAFEVSPWASNITVSPLQSEMLHFKNAT